MGWDEGSKGIRVFDHYGSGVRVGEMRDLPVSICVDTMIVDDVEVVSFSRVVTNPHICNNDIIHAIILNESASGYFRCKGCQKTQSG